jgi:hypothetical protein
MADIPSILRQVMDSSAQLSAWALVVGGGTVAVIVSTSYRRPDSIWWRLPYLLFLPGWAFIACSLQLGSNLVGKYLASLMVHKEQIDVIASQINDLYSDQRAYLLYSLGCFGLWLLIYLINWIFFKSFPARGNK